MADYNFTTADGSTIAREQLLLYLNTGTEKEPVWSLMGHRVEDSSMEMDWQRESVKDIVGATRNTMKKPIVTQAFDPWDLAGNDAAQKMIWDLAIVEQDANKLSNMDVLLEHRYAGFAERYQASSIEVTGLGGPGGGNISMPINVTFGGTRTVGSVSTNSTSGAVTFTPEQTATQT